MPTRHDVRCTVLLTALFATPLLSGCPGTPDPFLAGDLGQGTFTYACVNSKDQSCHIDEFTLPFVVAVGGRFNAKFQTNKGEALNVSVPTTELVARTDGSFRALAPGMFPLLALDGNSRVIDFKHVEAKKIAKVQLLSSNDQLFPNTFTLPFDTAQTFSVEAFDEDGVQLRGSIDFTWRAVDDRLALSEPDERGRVRVAPAHGGASAIEVGVLDQTFRIDVNVGAGRFDAGVETPALPALDGGLDAGRIGDDRDGSTP